MNKNKQIFLPAEWHPQSGVMLTWPHENSDWAYMLDEVEACFINIAREISKREKLLIVCQEKGTLLLKLLGCRLENIFFVELPSNDTWARDHGPITVIIEGNPVLYDFIFNGWGMKFAANFDNQITQNLYKENLFLKNVSYQNMLNFVLEGGSIESDGKGTLLTTEECLLSINRNDRLSKEEIEIYLKKIFGINNILWLSSGFLSGDDTDSHIDTLVRFCNENTIAYIKCTDSSDEHFVSLEKMEKQLRSFKSSSGEPYHLIELPMAEPVYEENNRLPATYANFLIINGAVLVPFYNSEKDQITKEQLQKAFPDREIIGIDCLPLIKQHGSLHCITMQFPKGVL